jgi:hypothetical protein
MLAGVSVTLIMTRRGKPRPGGINRWQRHGTIPLGVAGATLALLSRGSGQSAATHAAVVTVLLVAALLCAVVGAASTTRRVSGARQ